MGIAFESRPALAGAFLAILMPAQGVSGATLETRDFEGYPVVSNQELAELRGGFELNIGGQLLSLAFSLERVSYLNGQLQTLTRISVPDIAAAILSPQTVSVETYVAPSTQGSESLPVAQSVPGAAGNPAVPLPQAVAVEAVAPPTHGSEIPPVAQSVPDAAGNPAVPLPQAVAVEAVAPPAHGSESPPVAQSVPDVAGNPVNPLPQVSSTVPPAGTTPDGVSAPGQSAGGSVAVIQNGAGNSVALPANVEQQVNQAVQAAQAQILQAYNHATVIQNSLDNQVIRNMTTLNLTLTNAALARAVELNAALQNLQNMPIVLPK